METPTRYVAPCLLALLIGGCAVTPPTPQISQQAFQEELSTEAVTITVTHDRTLVDWGSGLLIGNDRVLTASHVIDTAISGDDIFVTHGVWRAKGHVVASGKRSTNDAAFLALDIPLEGKRSAPPPLCRGSSHAGASLLVVTPTTAVHTYALPPVDGMPVPAGAVEISTFFKPGASGSAVVDLEKRCIAGVVSRGSNDSSGAGVEGPGKIEWSDLSTILSDASTIDGVLVTLPKGDVARRILGD